MQSEKHDYHKLRVGLGWIIAALGAFAVFMSYGALYELAIAYKIPETRAWAFPVIIDLPAIAALLIARVVTDSRGWRRGYPWTVFTIFSGATIAGNAEIVSRIPTTELPGQLWIAVVIHSAPSIAALLTAHLAIETVFRKDRWTTKTTRPVSTSPRTVAVDPSPSPARVSRPKSTTTEARALVERLVDEGRTPAEIRLLHPSLARASVYKWAAARETENADRRLA